MRQALFLLLIFLCIVNFTFSQTDSYTDARDGQVYNTVTIGQQTWMAESLRFETDNSIALKVKKNKYQQFLDSGMKTARECGTTDEYGTKAITCEHLAKVGKYYPWADANIACPTGWHLASSEEWEQLFNYVTETKGLSENTKSVNQQNVKFSDLAPLLESKYWVNVSGATDDFGFSVMPDGHAKYDRVKLIGTQAQFWTSTPLIYKSGKQANGYYKYIDFAQFSKNITIEDGLEGYARSIRCVKD